jgi:hypothetical protein
MVAKDVRTRWNATLAMIARALILQEVSIYVASLRLNAI